MRNPLIRIPKKAQAAVALFLLALLVALATQCRPAHASDLWLEFGSTITRAEAPVIGFAIEWPRLGPSDTDYLLSLHLIGSAEGMDNQAALSAMFVDGLGRFDIGFGVCFLHHTDSISGSTANFSLAIAYRFGARYTVRERHCSNAGMTDVNKGRDLLLIGRKF